MRRILTIPLLVLLLFGCSSKNDQVDKAMTLRQTLLQANGCTFDASVTADYSDMLYTFAMQCSVDQYGNLSFILTQPTSVAGVAGNITAESGALTFDEEVLAFNELADDQISPICAPWVFINTLRSGYIDACEKNENGYRICLDDSYKEECLQLDIWANQEFTPYAAEISWQGCRVLTMEVSNFKIL